MRGTTNATGGGGKPLEKTLTVLQSAWTAISDGFRAEISDPDVKQGMYIDIAFSRPSSKLCPAGIFESEENSIWDGGFALETDEAPTGDISGKMVLMEVRI